MSLLEYLSSLPPPFISLSNVPFLQYLPEVPVYGYADPYSGYVFGNMAIIGAMQIKQTRFAKKACPTRSVRQQCMLYLPKTSARQHLHAPHAPTTLHITRTTASQYVSHAPTVFACFYLVHSHIPPSRPSLFTTHVFSGGRISIQRMSETAEAGRPFRSVQAIYAHFRNTWPSRRVSRTGIAERKTPDIQGMGAGAKK